MVCRGNSSSLPLCSPLWFCVVLLQCVRLRLTRHCLAAALCQPGRFIKRGGVWGLTPVTGGAATQQGEERRHSLVMAQTHGIRQVFLVRVACPSTVAAAARHSPSHTWHHRV